MKNVSVIGAGTMGNGIAHVMAQYNFKVTLIDISEQQLQKAKNTIEQNAIRQVNKGIITAEQQQQLINNITTLTSIEQGVAFADLVIEAATENKELKLKIFEQISKYAPQHCLLATNTSSISITQIAAATNRPQQVIGMHFMNPVPVMKLVEIINGYHTLPSVTAAIESLTLKIDKVPCIVNDYPGFIANKILMPMINEAIYSLYQGIAGVQEIDTIMKLGTAHPMGPLQLADFIGLDVCVNIMNVLYNGFADNKYAPCPLLINMVAADNLGVKTGEGFYKYTAGSKDLVVSTKFAVGK